MQEVDAPHSTLSLTFLHLSLQLSSQNGPVHVLVKMIHVLAEASEAETAGIFLGAQEVSPCSTLWWNWDTFNLLMGTHRD